MANTSLIVLYPVIQKKYPNFSQDLSRAILDAKSDEFREFLFELQELHTKERSRHSGYTGSLAEEVL